MNYEVVHLEEKIIVGVSAATSNSDPEMGKIIGGLWEKLYQGGINAVIKNKVNEYAIGLYSDYTADGYCVTAGNEVSKAENPELTVKTIPAGKYAKFSVHVMNEGHAFFAPHLLYPQLLDDSNPQERQAGLDMGLAMA